MSERTTYWMRCGWCGAYEGTVDPREPCATDPGTGEYSGPHQFQVSERVAWLPIESAPKDGTRVLLYSPGRTVGPCTVGYWLRPANVWYGPGIHEPSHFMPLPEAPE